MNQFSLVPEFQLPSPNPASKCFCCGVAKTGPKRSQYPVVRINNAIYREDHVQICGQCIEQMAIALGIAVNEEAAAARAEAKFEAQATDLQEALDEAAAELATYRKVIRDALDEAAPDE